MEEPDPADSSGPPAAPRYIPGPELGRGGFGSVIEATDTAIGRPVALKLLRADAPLHTVERFRWEGRVTGRLEHPGVVPVHEIGRLHGNGQLFIAMKKIGGQDMHRVIREGKWKLRRLVEALRDACRAVAYAHAKGVIHRDLKPANIMLGEFGETLVVDWGLARVVAEPEETLRGAVPGSLDLTAGSGETSQLTLDGDVLGTPAYMSPEQARGRLADIDRRSDVYSLGATLYEILAGQPPHAGATATECLESARRGNVEPPSKRRPAPPELEAICLRALSPRSEDRYEGVAELSAELDAWLEGSKDRERREGEAAGELKRARAAMDLRRQLAADALAAGREARTLTETIPTWEGESAKAPLWAARDRAETSRRRSLEVYADALGALASALSHVPDHAEARRLRAELAWQRFLEAEEAGDESEMVVNRRVAEQFHDGALAEALRDEGTLEVRARAFSCGCLAQGRDVSPGELDLQGWHPWSGRLLAGDSPSFAPEPEPGSPLRLRVHAASCRATPVAGIKAWVWLYAEADRVLVPQTAGSGGEPPPTAAMDALFGASPYRPRGPGRLLASTSPLPLGVGAWLVVVVAADGRAARSLVRVRRGQASVLDVTLFRAGEVPPGFQPILETETTLQGDRDVAMARNAVVERIPDFFLKRDVVSARDYAAFLDGLPPEEAARRVPRSSMAPNRPWWPRVGNKWILPTAEWFAAQKEDPDKSIGFPATHVRAWDPEWPVMSVTWFDAMAYARWLSARDGWLFTLPLGDQWEAAARGVDGRSFPWGKRFDPTWCNVVDSLQDGPRPARPSDFPRDESPWGIRGLAGNVQEQCLNAAGKQFPQRRQNRGSGWSRSFLYARAAHRMANNPASLESTTGFRLAGVVRLGQPHREI
ncbi:MAG: protein kinase [Planctomycetota bacterium]